MEAKEYINIKTIEELCDIANVGNVENLITDLSTFLRLQTQLMIQTRLMSKDNLSLLRNSQIIKCEFRWCDDGNNDYQIEIREKDR